MKVHAVGSWENGFIHGEGPRCVMFFSSSFYSFYFYVPTLHPDTCPISFVPEKRSEVQLHPSSPQYHSATALISQATTSRPHRRCRLLLASGESVVIFPQHVRSASSCTLSPTIAVVESRPFALSAA